MNSQLASYAVSDKNTKGRQFEIEKAIDRNDFQRDYTRILHSQSFRKLQGKTQVFSPYFGQSSIANKLSTFRTRMSHSFEVEQISRSIARALGLNQDLCATLAIGHDIGHPPFGHMGQDILNEQFKSIGGFEHNYQALKLVDEIESPYLEYKGLNLMFETREGLLKHCTIERAKKVSDVAKRHIDGTSPPLEVQVVDVADQIAYLYADLEDAVDYGLVKPSFLMSHMPSFKKYWKEGTFIKNKSALVKGPVSIHNKAAINEVWRAMLSDSLIDVINQSKKNINEMGVVSLEDVRLSHPLIRLSDERKHFHRNIRKFSREHIYGHEDICQQRDDGKKALEFLCESVKSHPENWGYKKGDFISMLDFIAGLTDGDVMEWYYKNNHDINLSQSHKTKSHLSLVK